METQVQEHSTVTIWDRWILPAVIEIMLLFWSSTAAHDIFPALQWIRTVQTILLGSLLAGIVLIIARCTARELSTKLNAFLVSQWVMRVSVFAIGIAMSLRDFYETREHWKLPGLILLLSLSILFLPVWWKLITEKHPEAET